ncbi:Chaperone protein YajL [Planctomycetes bacterium Poly30]|uniref:Chaperone protein YajL n=1 Tax=Saltatorellus ferox TaxID=2528018 RepID=A0A518EKX6_9BACT|nr:Chaperone protein YajL [Planctomycetes bacterium Poly30]
MKKTVLVPLAEGFEEMEAVILIDVLRRAGIEVIVAGLEGAGPVLGSRGITVVAEADMDEMTDRAFDAVALPGGLGGTIAMRDDPRVVAAVRASAAAGRLTAAICAAPLVLKKAGLAEGRTLTGHPSVHEEMRAAGATLGGDRVVRDGELLTSLGPGSAFEFALALVTDLEGEARAAEISTAMCMP